LTINNDQPITRKEFYLQTWRVFRGYCSRYVSSKATQSSTTVLHILVILKSLFQVQVNPSVKRHIVDLLLAQPKRAIILAN
jgi:hypothetical protein